MHGAESHGIYSKTGDFNAGQRAVFTLHCHVDFQKNRDMAMMGNVTLEISMHEERRCREQVAY